MKKIIAGLISFLLIALVGCSDIGTKIIDVSEYEVFFDAQGGAAIPKDTVLTGTMITLPATSRTDFIFNGWFDSPIGGKKVGMPGDKIKIKNHTVFYAQWTAIYTVTFDAQGGLVSPSSVRQPDGTTITLPTATKSGFVLRGWYSEADGGYKVGTAGGSYTISSDITLYAQWAVMYTITFDANGGTVSPTSITELDGEIIYLPTPTRPNFRFDGWFSEADGGTQYYNPFTVPEYNLTMYAHWTRVYTITFDAQGGSVSPQSVSHPSGETIYLPTPVKIGYEFDGWFSAASSGTKYDSPYIVREYDVTMYAQWTFVGIPPATYTVYFVDADGFADYSPITREAGETIDLPTPTRSGYTFNGWFSEVSGGTKYNTPYVVKEYDVTMYARWTIIPPAPTQKYTITFEVDGGSAVSPIQVDAGTHYTPTASPAKTGFTFAGWYKDAAFNNPWVNGTAVNSDITLYAKWTPNAPVSDYTVTFNPNGGNVSPTSRTQAAGTSMTLPIPTRDGYTFDGWFSTASGGTKYDNPYTVTASNITMYAHWTAVSITITFDANGGNVSPSNVTYPPGNTTTLPTPTRSGYTFDGWYSAPTGGTKYGDAGSSYTVPTSNITMYAHWTPIMYTIKFVDGATEWSVFKAPNGTPVTLPEISKSGYTFKGWSETAGGSVKYNAWESYTVSGDITLYAKWEP